MHKTLHNWDNSLSDAQHAHLDRLLSRREFLSRSLKTVGAMALLPVAAALPACQQERAASQQSLLTTEPWNTFAAIQQHLFPDDGNGPGSAQFNATLYLKFVLAAKDTDPEEREFILNGIGWLNELAQQQQHQPFIACTTDQQDNLIHAIIQSRAGERWISYLLTYILEALLSDPLYGGNPDGIGWQWLQHQAGFPRPPVDKSYQRLLEKKHDGV